AVFTGVGLPPQAAVKVKVQVTNKVFNFIKVTLLFLFKFNTFQTSGAASFGYGGECVISFISFS
ncbi:MAG: hypothetical protein ABF262_01945, partial [Glaciecola sp.]